MTKTWAIAARYNQNGSRDWKTRVGFSGSSMSLANAVLVDRHDRVVLAGTTGVTRGFDHAPVEELQFALFRFDADGTLDDTFHNDGGVRTGFTTSLISGASAWVKGAAIDANDRIVAAGSVEGKIALARYNPDGSLDESFGSDGKVVTDFTSQHEEMANAVAVDREGRIYVGGHSRPGPSDGLRFALARYRPNGALDRDFHRDGKIVTNLIASRHEGGVGLALTPADQVVVAGFAHVGSDGGGRFALAKYNLDGSLDKTFSSNGINYTNITTSDAEHLHAVIVDAEDRIIVAGSAPSERGGQFALARYNHLGELDQSFHHNGYVEAEFLTASGRSGGSARGIALDQFGRIVVAGFGPDGKVAVARFKTNGDLDASFGSDGKVVTDFQSTEWEGAMGVAVDSQNGVIMGGFAHDFQE